MATEATYERVLSWRLAAVWLSLAAVALLGSFLLGRLLVSRAAHHPSTAVLSVLPTGKGVPASLAPTPAILTLAQLKPPAKRPARVHARAPVTVLPTTITPLVTTTAAPAVAPAETEPVRPSPRVSRPAPSASAPSTFDSSE
jgi:hypothetical protein